MRIDNYSYRPSFQRLDMDEKTTEYIAKNASREDLPRIAQTCNLLQNSILSLFSINSSNGCLEVNVSEVGAIGFPRHRATITGSGNLSILDVFETCLGYVKDRNVVPIDGAKATDYMKEFEKYI